MLEKTTVKLSHLSFRSKLAISLGCICLVVILVVGISSYQLAANELRNLSTKISEKNIMTTEQNLSAYLDKVEDYTARIMNIPALRNMSEQELSEAEAATLSMEVISGIHRYMRVAEANNLSFQAIEFYSGNGHSLRYQANFATEFQNYSSCLDALAAFNPSAAEPLHTDRYTRTLWLIYPLTENRTRQIANHLVCVRFLYDSLMKKRGILIAAINDKELYRTYSSYAEDSFIMGSDGRLRSATQTNLIGTKLPEADLRDKILRSAGEITTFSVKNKHGAIKLYSCHPTLDNSAVLVIPFDFYTGISQQERNNYLLSIGILLIAVMIITFWLVMQVSRRLSRSLYELADVVKRIDDGDLTLRYTATGQDEVAYLGEKINNMLDSIMVAVQLREKQLEARRLLEIKLMQSQINPHLLYNTLDAVLWNQQNNRSENATALTAALSGFFKYSLAKGSSMTSLGKEIQLIRYYLSIQQLAREQDISLELEVPPELMEAQIIKLSLQPLVENAIIHGFSGYRDNGRIVLRAVRQAELLVISVTDNGIGMTEDELSDLRKNLEIYPPPDNMKSFGLYNINWRIKKTYGDSYALNVESSLCEYTTITLTFPFSEYSP